MTSSNDAANIVKSAGYKWLDNVYTNFIPKKHLEDSDSTDILITENINAPATFGNGTFSEMKQGVEIHLFYSLDFDEEADDCEISLMKLFMENNWLVENSDARYVDPDTGQSIKAIYVSHKKTIGGS